MRVFGYLSASTDQQNASRAKSTLEKFADANNQTVSAWFIDNDSGAKLKRPELFRLLEIVHQDDVLLVEQVDRINRLNTAGLGNTQGAHYQQRNTDCSIGSAHLSPVHESEQ